MIRFGVIGTNWITDRFIKDASEHEQFTLAAVYSRTMEKGNEFARKYGVDIIYTNLEEMAKSMDIDAVYIASPNSLHAGQAKVLMENGKHVLCEKPIASNAEEFKEMAETAKANGVVLMEALKSTLLPNFQAIRENLHKIGKVRRYVASYCQYSSRYDSYKEGVILNAFKPEFSNGSLMDIGVYCLYPLVVLFGKPEAVNAIGILLESGVDGEGSILLRYENMEAVVMYSKISNSSQPSEIQGEEGNIVIDKISSPEKVEIHYRDGRIENITVPQSDKSMFYEAKEFIELILAGQKESSVNSHENSLAVLEIMDEARKQIGVKYPSDQV